MNKRPKSALSFIFQQLVHTSSFCLRLMPRHRFLRFFRYALGTVATIYATIVTLQSLWGWYVWLAGSDKYISLVRRYVVVHGLRLRFRAFWGDVLVCILSDVTFLILCHAHHLIYDLGDRAGGLEDESGTRMSRGSSNPPNPDEVKLLPDARQATAGLPTGPAPLRPIHCSTAASDVAHAAPI